MPRARRSSSGPAGGRTAARTADRSGDALGVHAMRALRVARRRDAAPADAAIASASATLAIAGDATQLPHHAHRAYARERYAAFRGEPGDARRPRTRPRRRNLTTRRGTKPSGASGAGTGQRVKQCAANATERKREGEQAHVAIRGGSQFTAHRVPRTRRTTVRRRRRRSGRGDGGPASATTGHAPPRSASSSSSMRQRKPATAGEATKRHALVRRRDVRDRARSTVSGAG